MQGNPVITLTTDFGYEDPFAGVMKGVIKTINPLADIIDLSHGIPPQDIRTAAYTIGMSYRYFPNESIHVVVVDPGVGSERRPLIVMTDRHYFIGPDNGVFSYIYHMQHEQLLVTHITAEHYFLSSRGTTFHGRDVFAPVAAWFSKGITVAKFGDQVQDYQSIDLPAPTLADGRLHGEVIHIDRFGNAITNISSGGLEAAVSSRAGSAARIVIKGKTVPVKKYYSQGNDGGLYALLNSSDLVEFFVFRGSAALEHGITVGDAVEVSSSG